MASEEPSVPSHVVHDEELKENEPGSWSWLDASDDHRSAKNWEEAYWYIWGQAQRLAKQQGNQPDPNALPGSAHTVDVIHDSQANAARGTPRGRQNVSDKYRIDDPEERKTKKQFERILGKRISDEEWIRLADEDIKTLDDYQDLQADLQQRAG